MNNPSKLEQCPGCHAFFTPSTMGTDRYRGASTGCWSVCNQIFVKEFQDPDYFKAHRLTVDSYGVQPSRKS